MSTRVHLGPLLDAHRARHWKDRDGDEWSYDPDLPSWVCHGKKILAATIWDSVPARFGPFEAVEASDELA